MSQVTQHGSCRICDQFPIDGDDGLCRWCREDPEGGRKAFFKSLELFFVHRSREFEREDP